MENPTRVWKIQIFFYCVKKTLLVNYFQKYTFKVPQVPIFVKSRKVWNTAQSTKMADEIYPKLYIFNTPVQKIWSIQNEAISLVAMRSKEFWLVEKNCATVKPDSRVAPWTWTYSESRIELRNLQILKKTLEKSSQFLSSKQLCEPKGWTLPWKLQELKKYPRKSCGYGQPRGDLIRVLNERSVNDGEDFCLLWLVILKSAWYTVGDTF